MKSKEIDGIIIGAVIIVILAFLAIFSVFDLSDQAKAQIITSSLLSIIPLLILYVNRLENTHQRITDEKKEALERLRSVMIQNYNMIDLESVKFALSVMHFDKVQARNIFSHLVRQLQENGHRADMSLFSEDDEFYEKYKNHLIACMEKYGLFIDDMLLLCNLFPFCTDDSLLREKIDGIVMQANRLSSLDTYTKNLILNEEGLIHRLSSISPGSDYKQEVEGAMNARMDDLFKLYAMKGTLSAIELELLNKKQKEIAER